MSWVGCLTKKKTKNKKDTWRNRNVFLTRLKESSQDTISFGVVIYAFPNLLWKNCNIAELCLKQKKWWIIILLSESPIFTLPNKTSLWGFSLNPSTHVWKHQMLHEQNLSEILNLYWSNIHKTVSPLDFKWCQVVPPVRLQNTTLLLNAVTQSKSSIKLKTNNEDTTTGSIKKLVSSKRNLQCWMLTSGIPVIMNGIRTIS